jgi:hypothetical protein
VKYGNRGLRRDPLDVTPEILIEHQIAQHKNASMVECFQDINARHVLSSELAGSLQQVPVGKYQPAANN